MPDRVSFLATAFLSVLTGTAAVMALYILAYILVAPILALSNTPAADRARRIMTGYLFVGPFILVNLAVVFGLFAMQYVAVQWIYGTAANPHLVFERAFAVAGGAAGRAPELVVLQRLGSGGEPSAVMVLFTKVVWACYGGVAWGIVAFLVFSMFRDLGVTSWSLAAGPVRRVVHEWTWWRLIKEALARFLHVALYTFFSGFFYVASAVVVLGVSWLTLRMLAGLLVTYLAAVSGGWTAFTLLGSFYVVMLEVLGGLFFATGLLSFIASRVIGLRVELAMSWVFGLPRPVAVIPRLWPTLQASGLLLGKVLVAVVPLWLVMGFVVAPLFPAIISAPFGALLHLAGFNLLLWLMRAHRDLKPLVAEAWAGRPWSVPARESSPAPVAA
jgi:hypothetical protein